MASGSPKKAQIRLYTEIVKKPKEMLLYRNAYGMDHQLAPTHSEPIVVILGEHYPTLLEARPELNGLPLTAEVWNARGPALGRELAEQRP